MFVVPLDIVFILGSSRPNATQKFNAQKSLVNAVMEKLEISRDAVLPAFVSYGATPTVESRIGAITDKSTALRVLKGIVNYRNSSDLASAFHLVDSSVLSTEQGARENASRTILIFVDKDNTGDRKVVNKLTRKYKDEGTKLIIIAIGDDVNKDDLKALTHDNGEIFFPPSLEDLERMIEPVSVAVKPGRPLRLA